MHLLSDNGVGATHAHFDAHAPAAIAPSITIVDDRAHLVADLADTRAEDVAPERPHGSVLFITSRFPPVASVGATRIRKFAKYLGVCGWRPVVLTGPLVAETEFSQNKPIDLSALADVPGDIEVYRLRHSTAERPEDAGRAACRTIAALTGRLGLDEVWWRDRIGWRVESLVDRLSWPDRVVWRINRAVMAALRLHARHRFDAILSSGMPFSDHLVALLVRRLIQRPWLADFRDPWVEYVHWDQWKGPWTRRCTEWAEAAVVHDAIRVISVNEHMTRRFAERYPDARREKFATIENGFDPIDFAVAMRDRPVSRETTCFRMVYAGSFYGMRRPDVLLRGFQRFLETVPDSARRARFDFLGRAGSHVELLNEFPYSGTVRFLGHRPHAEALRTMVEADLNVVVLPDLPGGDGDTTAKVYECLGSGRPILAAVPRDGAAARVLSGFDGVTICEPNDPEAVAAAIRHWYIRWLADDVCVRRDAGQLRPLTRQHQTRMLANILNEVAPRRRSRPRKG